MPEESRTVIVTVTDNALGDIQRVADELAAEGMSVEQVMPVTGVITGSYPTPQISRLASIEGVESVEEEVTARLPPSDSTRQ